MKTVFENITNDSKKNNRLILKLQQRFRRKKHNVSTEKVSKIALSAANDKTNTNNRFNRNICIWNK